MSKRIGIVGYSTTKFDEWEAKNILYKVFDDILSKYGKDAIIVSGGTMYGIPKMTYFMASNLGLKTVGVICEQGLDDNLFPGLEDIIVEGKDWGDESNVFIDTIDVLYRIGGGPQSLKEVDMAKKKGIPVTEYELEKIEE